MVDFGAIPTFVLTVSRCPKCGEYPRGISVTASALAHCYTETHGNSFEFNGHVQIGTAHEFRKDKQGRVTAKCGGSHEWKTEIIEVQQ